MKCIKILHTKKKKGKKSTFTSSDKNKNEFYVHIKDFLSEFLLWLK